MSELRFVTAGASSTDPDDPHSTAMTGRPTSPTRKVLRVHAHFAPLYGGVIGAGLAVSLGPEAGSRALWMVGAQIIPVVLIALALQARVFRFEIPQHGFGDGLDDFERTINEVRRDVGEEVRRMRSKGEESGSRSFRARTLSEAVDTSSEEPTSDPECLDAAYSQGNPWIAAADDLDAYLERRLHSAAAFVARQRRWSNAFSAGLGVARAIYVALGMALLALGEFRALEVLASGEYASRPGLLLAAIGFGFGAMFVAAIVPGSPKDDHS